MDGDEDMEFPPSKAEPIPKSPVKRRRPARRKPRSYHERHTTLSMPVDIKKELGEILEYLKEDEESGIYTWNDMLQNFYPILRDADIPDRSTFYRHKRGQRFTTVWVSTDLVKKYKEEVLPKFGDGKNLWQPLFAYILKWWNSAPGDGGGGSPESG